MKRIGYILLAFISLSSVSCEKVAPTIDHQPLNCDHVDVVVGTYEGRYYEVNGFVSPPEIVDSLMTIVVTNASTPEQCQLLFSALVSRSQIQPDFKVECFAGDGSSCPSFKGDSLIIISEPQAINGPLPYYHEFRGKKIN